MDDAEERALVRVHERLAILGEKIAGLNEHKAGKGEMEAGIRDGDFRTLQEVGGLIGGLRSDVKDWIQASKDETTLKLTNLQTEIMAALRADRNWQRQLPTWIALAMAAIAILTGNPHLLRYLGGQ